MRGVPALLRSLLVGPAALLLVAGVAALVPALRAARLDPAGVLADH